MFVRVLASRPVDARVRVHVGAVGQALIGHGTSGDKWRVDRAMFGRPHAAARTTS
jgi:hypothetical protein